MIRLLIDHNLSPRLVARLADIFPNSQHVAYLNMADAKDSEIWEYARSSECLIVTKDADFGEFSIVWGVPPKVIWIQRGNCSTNDIEAILRQNHELIQSFCLDGAAAILTLY